MSEWRTGSGQYLHFGRCACKRQLVPSRTSADLGEQKANQAVRGPLGSLVIPLRHGQTSVMAIPGKSPVPRKGPRSTPPGPVGACISQNARASGNSYLHGHQRPPETPPCDTTLRPEGDGFEPSVPRERDYLTRLPRLTATAFPCGREGRTRLPHAPSGGLTQWRAANVRVIGLIRPPLDPGRFCEMMQDCVGRVRWNVLVPETRQREDRSCPRSS
jgi:hypothetical protein